MISVTRKWVSKFQKKRYVTHECPLVHNRGRSSLRDIKLSSQPLHPLIHVGNFSISRAPEM